MFGEEGSFYFFVSILNIKLFFKETQVALESWCNISSVATLKMFIHFIYVCMCGRERLHTSKHSHLLVYSSDATRDRNRLCQISEPGKQSTFSDWGTESNIWVIICYWFTAEHWKEVGVRCWCLVSNPCTHNALQRF